MVKKQEWFKVRRSTTSKNVLSIKNGSVDYKVKFFDKQKNEAKKWDDLEQTGGIKNTAKIILSFESDRGAYSEDSQDVVEYRLVDGALRERKAFKKAEQEANIRYFKERYSDKFDNNYIEDSGSDISYRFVNNGEKGIGLDLKKKGGDNLSLIIGSGEVEVFFNAYLTRKISLEDLMGDLLSEEENNKPYWTSRKITFLVFLVIIFLLIVIFWKKLWGWIRGKSKQEKKIEEQIDIF